MSFTDIFAYIVKHYIISAIVIFLLVRTVYAIRINHLIKAEHYKVAELLIQWWHAPEEEGGYGAKPLEYVEKKAFYRFRGYEHNTILNTIPLKSAAEYTSEHIDSKDARASEYLASVINNLSEYQILGVEDDPYSVVILSQHNKSYKPYLLYLCIGYTRVYLPGKVSDVKIRLKQHYHAMFRNVPRWEDVMGEE